MVSKSQQSSFSSDNPLFSPSRILILLIVLICIIGIFHFVRNHPKVEAKPTTATISLPGQFAVAFPQQGESAVGTDSLGVIASSPDQTPVPIASVTKIMTAYLVLQAHPLKPGEVGPTLTMTAEDVANYKNDLALDYSVLEVKEGEQLTEKQLLEALLLPSADNIATALARWVAGSDDAFIAKMNETAQTLGMTSTHYADVSGVSEATVSSAVDQIKIAQVAMQDPIFREIVSMPQATFQTAGTIYNVDSMLGQHGIVGIKTGSTLAAGGCFVSATPIGVGADKHYIIGAVLGQKTAQSLQSALDLNAQILDQARSQIKLYPLSSSANSYGQIIDPWNSNSVLNSDKAVQIWGYPGMTASLSVDVQDTQLPIPSGSNIATLKVQSSQSVQQIPLQNSEQINPPSFFWRLFRNWI
ncbi:D-alanyl-D-alanine carboxypeptidase (penicillin-binding protein 5/6) [Sporomusaceae bacterium BoRhaA]|uniref:D-alanyl-D-alanine carboxypeptidase family protein n=1 Tax=Pelorhabdus rhamnosifermentans TaxID=2772457 RepID=UPI001C063F82|nr:serine hydrolase [Pelorhabdus rhamnosifermentans]MBU2702870.1 D-alanyl-D-alanine carboxypeptidase (penicillin-binding protein 5/6) [Pelorhabdus rhamnosifermentans]